MGAVRLTALDLRRRYSSALSVRGTPLTVQAPMTSVPKAIDGAVGQCPGGLSALLGESVGMRRLRERVSRLSPTPVGVLILGETGTGKELVARAIHHASPRQHGPFVPVNCGALSGELIDAELFGHERGAFTGAVGSRGGRAAEAHRGTLFLDEIAELALPLQSKLLRLLQEGEIQRVGSDRPVGVDVRVVAATNRDLPVMVKRGLFRADCYYRLSSFIVKIPPLRERASDVVLLAEHFTARFARELRRPIPAIQDSARLLLCRYDWPGNVRELEHVVRESVLYCESGTITAADVQVVLEERAGFGRCASEAPPLEEVLARCAGNVTRAARELGISRPTLYKRMRDRGVDGVRYRRVSLGRDRGGEAASC